MAELAKKLQLKPGNRVRLIDAPPGYADALDLPTGAGFADGEAEVVQAFVTWQKDLERLVPLALGALIPGGVLWMAYPKKSAGVASDMSRDITWGPLAEAGYRPVSQVALDDTWSALRFRPVEDVRSRRPAGR